MVLAGCTHGHYATARQVISLENLVASCRFNFAAQKWITRQSTSRPHPPLPCGVDIILGLNGFIWISKHVKESEQIGEEGFDAQAIYSNKNDVRC
jgi:hypothetical protein